jgi:hypothetical protein
MVDQIGSPAAAGSAERVVLRARFRACLERAGPSISQSLARRGNPALLIRVERFQNCWVRLIVLPSGSVMCATRWPHGMSLAVPCTSRRPASLAAAGRRRSRRTRPRRPGLPARRLHICGRPAAGWRRRTAASRRTGPSCPAHAYPPRRRTARRRRSSVTRCRSYLGSAGSRSCSSDCSYPSPFTHTRSRLRAERRPRFSSVRCAGGPAGCGRRYPVRVRHSRARRRSRRRR